MGKIHIGILPIPGGLSSPITSGSVLSGYKEALINNQDYLVSRISRYKGYILFLYNNWKGWRLS